MQVGYTVDMLLAVRKGKNMHMHGFCFHEGQNMLKNMEHFLKENAGMQILFQPSKLVSANASAYKITIGMFLPRL